MISTKTQSLTKDNFHPPKRAIAFALGAGIFAIILIFSIVVNATSAMSAISIQATIPMKIVQDKDTKKDMLKSFMYIGEKMDWDIKLNGKYIAGSKAADVTWTSSNNNVATIVDPGVMTAVGRGTTTITAKYNNGKDKATATAVLTVKQKVTSVVLSKTQVYINQDDTLQLTATLNPPNADDRLNGVSWVSLNPSIASVDSNGLVTAVGIGSASIRATFTNKGVLINQEGDTKDEYVSTLSTVIVEYFDYSKVYLDNSSPIVHPGEIIDIKATYTPSNITWENENPELINLSATGTDNIELTIEGILVGDALIKAKAIYQGSETETSFVVHVRNWPPTGISLDENSHSMKVGESFALSYTVFPAEATMWPVSYQSTDEEVATVDVSGNVLAISSNLEKDGSSKTDCDIIATVVGQDEYDNEVKYYATCSLKVKNVSPEQIQLSESETILHMGDLPYQIIYNVLPVNTTIKDVIFLSEDEQTALVSNDGKVSPVSFGTTNIVVKSAYDESVFAKLKAIVVPRHSDKIELGQDSLVIGVNKSKKIEILACPNTDSFTFTSSDSSIATVDSDGYVTGKNRGSIDVTVSCFDKDNNKTVDSICEVRVIKYVEQIILSEEELNLTHPSGQYLIEATVLPQDADVKTLLWLSSNTDIATVDQDGTITARGYGQTTITASSTDGSNVKTTMELFIAIPVSGIEASPDLRGHVLFVDGADRDSIILTGEVFTKFATFKDMKWSASSDAVSLSVSGQNNNTCKVTASKASEDVSVTVQDIRGYKSASVKLKVRVKPSAVSITLVPKPGYVDSDPIILTNNITHTFQLVANVSPADAFNKEVTWESLSPDIKIDTNGNVSISKESPSGTHSIKATTKDGAKVAIRSILLRQGVRQILVYNPKEDENGGEGYVYLFKTVHLKVDLYPKDVYMKEVDVSVINPHGADYPDSDMVKCSYDRATSSIAVDGNWTSDLFGGKSASIIVKSKDGTNIIATYKILVIDEPD